MCFLQLLDLEMQLNIFSGVVLKIKNLTCLLAAYRQNVNARVIEIYEKVSKPRECIARTKSCKQNQQKPATTQPSSKERDQQDSRENHLTDYIDQTSSTCSKQNREESASAHFDGHPFLIDNKQMPATTQTSSKERDQQDSRENHLTDYIDQTSSTCSKQNREESASAHFDGDPFLIDNEQMPATTQTSSKKSDQQDIREVHDIFIRQRHMASINNNNSDQSSKEDTNEEASIKGLVKPSCTGDKQIPMTTNSVETIKKDLVAKRPYSVDSVTSVPKEMLFDDTLSCSADCDTDSEVELQRQPFEYIKIFGVRPTYREPLFVDYFWDYSDGGCSIDAHSSISDILHDSQNITNYFGKLTLAQKHALNRRNEITDTSSEDSHFCLIK